MSVHKDAVETAARTYRDAQTQIKSARAGVCAAVVAALKAGERPTDVAAWSPFTATYVRKLARKAGLPKATWHAPRS